MAIEVRIPTILRSYTGGEKAVEAKGDTLQGLIDDRYIGHRLREGFGVLRVSRGPFHDSVPYVVNTWGVFRDDGSKDLG